MEWGEELDGERTCIVLDLPCPKLHQSKPTKKSVTSICQERPLKRRARYALSNCGPRSEANRPVCQYSRPMSRRPTSRFKGRTLTVFSSTLQVCVKNAAPAPPEIPAPVARGQLSSTRRARGIKRHGSGQEEVRTDRALPEVRKLVPYEPQHEGGLSNCRLAWRAEPV